MRRGECKTWSWQYCKEVVGLDDSDLDNLSAPAARRHGHDAFYAIEVRPRYAPRRPKSACHEFEFV